MKIFLDTSVLVAAFVAGHPHHAQSLTAVESVRNKTHSGFISGHALPEVYAVLTRTPFNPAIFPQEAWKIISANILPHFGIVPLTAAMYQSTIEACADHGWIGGRIYDALHLSCAQQAVCDRIYTLNVRHFQQLRPDLADHIGVPSSFART